MVEESKFYTLKEAADKLRVSDRTLLRWCKEKRIDHFNVSARKFLIEAKALDEFMEEMRVGRRTVTQGRKR